MKLLNKALPLIVLSSVAFGVAKTDSTLLYFAEGNSKNSLTYPGSPVAASKIQNPKASFSPNTYCTDIGSNGKFNKNAFQLTHLKYSFNKDYKKTRPNGSPYIECHYAAEYKVNCGNGLSYKGDFKWGISTVGKSSSKWTDVPLSEYNATTGKFLPKKACRDLNRVPTEEIFKIWNGRKVAFPEKKNGSKKLARPVVFVPGHNSSFIAFGAQPIGKTDPSDANYLNGNVSGYDDGSLPDIIARDQNLDVSAKGINKNGLYFFTAPYEKKNGNLVQVLPQWKNNQSKKSISFALYKYLENVLAKHYGKNWWKSDKNQVDLVAHSQGGLVVREMLRGLRANSKLYPVGNKNAANHIRRVVTVNTPHFGSELADDYKTIQKSYPAVAAFIKEVQDQKNMESKTKQSYYKNQTLLYAKVDKDLKKFFQEGASKNAANMMLQQLNLDKPVLSAIGESLFPTSFLTGMLGAATDVSVRLTGSYVGDFKLQTNYRVMGGLLSKRETKKIDFLKPLRDTLWAWHVDGSHLATHSAFVQALTEEGYPKLPNGKKVQMRPMFSSDMRGIRNYMMNQLAEGSTEFCRGSDVAKSSCFSVTTFINTLLYKSKGLKLSQFEGVQKWLDFYNNLMEEWLGSSDLLVTSYSQQFMDKKKKLGPKYQKEFLQPRTYTISLSQMPNVSPFNFIPHGDVLDYGSVDNSNYNLHLKMIKHEGAPRKGLDLYCALDDSKCNLVKKKIQYKKAAAIGGIVWADVEKVLGGA